jgi:hypothetical protein
MATRHVLFLLSDCRKRICDQFIINLLFRLLGHRWDTWSVHLLPFLSFSFGCGLRLRAYFPLSSFFAAAQAQDVERPIFFSYSTSSHSRCAARFLRCYSRLCIFTPFLAISLGEKSLFLHLRSLSSCSANTTICTYQFIAIMWFLISLLDLLSLSALNISQKTNNGIQEADGSLGGPGLSSPSRRSGGTHVVYRMAGSKPSFEYGPFSL